MSDAESILAQHWDGRLPVDPIKIARSMGVDVVMHDFTDETVCETGLLNGTRTIRLGRQEGVIRKRFAVAHALGHIVLHPHLLREF